MSLINEALKKAQRDGNGKDAPAARSPDVTSAALKSRKPGVAVVAGGIVAILAVAGGAGYYFTKEAPKPEAVAMTPTPKVETRPAAEARVVVKPTETPVSPVVSSPEVKPAAETSPVGEVIKPVEAVAKVEAPALVKPAAPVVPVPPPAPVLPAAPVQNPEITAMLDRMKVSLGRKKTGRCVIDGMVFKVGDQLSSSPVINIKAVTDAEVVFSDVNGVEYAKKYK